MDENVDVVMVEPEGGVNLGLICRLADNFDVDNIILVNPNFMDEDYDLAEVFASRAAHRLEKIVVVDSLEKAVENSDVVIATTGIRSLSYPFRGSIDVWELGTVLRNASPSRISVVFGRESIGLTKDELGLADVLVTIPTSKRYPSMNVATAAAIVLHHIYTYRVQGERSGEGLREGNEYRLIRRYVHDLAERVLDRPNIASTISQVVVKCLYRGVDRKEDLKLILTLFRRLHTLLTR